MQGVGFGEWGGGKMDGGGKNGRLIGDIPFGMSRQSVDTWANPQLFDLEWAGGAPPETNFQTDPFTVKWGQNWGIPHYVWERHKEQNFAWWRQRIQGVGSCFHGFRIDHVMGFFRIYSFPWAPERNNEFLKMDWDEAKKKNGGRFPQFLPGPDDVPESAQRNEKQGEYLLKVVLQTADELRMDVVAEDLGTVPPYGRPVLKQLNIPGFSIPTFDRDEKTQEFQPMQKLPELSLATYATHDFPPLASTYEDIEKHWQGFDAEGIQLERKRLMRMIGVDDRNPPEELTKELHLQFMKALLSSPCWLAVFMVTDMLGVKQRFNLPGTCGQFNWGEPLG